MRQITISTLTKMQHRWVIAEAKKFGVSVSAIIKILIQNRIDEEINEGEKCNSNKDGTI